MAIQAPIELLEQGTKEMLIDYIIQKNGEGYLAVSGLERRRIVLAVGNVLAAYALKNYPEKDLLDRIIETSGSAFADQAETVIRATKAYIATKRPRG